jgi:hypothetical protein
MQVNHFEAWNRLSRYNRPISWLLIAGSSTFVIHKISTLPDFQMVSFSHSLLWLIPLMLVMSAFNWSLEGLKWKYSLQEFDHISFSQAIVNVLNGVALNWIFPFTTGDLLARMQGKNLKRSGHMVFVNRLMMVMITFLYGLISAILLELFPIKVLMSMTVLTLLVGVSWLAFELKTRL